MHKFITYILFFIILFQGSPSRAQYDDSTMDTLAAPQVYVTKNDQPDFLPITNTPRIEEKKVPDEKVRELRNDEDYWYANLELKKKKQEQPAPANEKSIWNQGWFNDLLWVIILVSFIAVVAWYLFSSNIRLFRKPAKKILVDEETEVTEDIFLLQYEREINKALMAGNYRLAIRLWYLGTLKDLAEKNIIVYSHEKTNSEYVATLANGPYHRDFFRLTRNFEYTWYGQFPLSREGYEFLEKDFTRFKNSLR